PRLRRGRGFGRGGRVSGWAVAVARDRGPGGRAVKRRGSVLPAGPLVHPGGPAARGTRREGAVRALHDDAALLRPVSDRVVDRRAARRRLHAAGPDRRGGRRRAAPAAGGERADRGSRHGPLPAEERRLRWTVAAVGRLLSAGFAARPARAALRRPGSGCSVGPSVYVQPGRDHRNVAPPLRRRARSPAAGMTPRQEVLRDALAAVPFRLATTIARARPAPAGEWTPQEVLRH